MDEDRNRLKHDSVGTTYTFRDKHGNIVNSSDLGQITDNSAEKYNQQTTCDEGKSSKSYLKYGNMKSSRLEEEKENRLIDQDEEQPSMLTTSELRSVDLNVLGEWYIPSSDVFSDQKETDNYEFDDKNKESEVQIDLESRNRKILAKRNKDQTRIDSCESQKLDSLLK
jgi:formate dehydrogenase assembly factor FdhD